MWNVGGQGLRFTFTEEIFNFPTSVSTETRFTRPLQPPSSVRGHRGRGEDKGLGVFTICPSNVPFPIRVS